MYNTPGSGTLNGNSGGQEEARPQPIPGGEGVGREADHPPELGAGGSQASGLCPETPSEHPGRRHLDEASGFHTADDLIAATLNGSIPRPPTREGRKLSYPEQLRDVRWKHRRDELLLRRNYTCCECNRPLTTGTMDLQSTMSCTSPAWLLGITPTNCCWSFALGTTGSGRRLNRQSTSW